MLAGMRCLECGAMPRGMKLCHDLFDDLLGIKYREDGEAYRLAVACYTMQHPRSHSAKAWWYACYYLEALVYESLSSQEARERGRERYEHHQSQTQGMEVPLLRENLLPWTMTIADFSDQVLQEPLSAATTWAYSIVQDYQRHQASIGSLAAEDRKKSTEQDGKIE